MNIVKKIKNNLFAFIVIIAYIALFAFSPSMGVNSIKNSGFYIKEMLMIMPVIFVLTALLDLWIPKEKIMQFLGKESKSKGVFLSLVIGSVSAGPIYAAFPMCVMLLKKGAAIRNIIIILSSWAVIKIPMLLNEAKFLGAKFMIIRWLLTVIAILIFSWISAKIIKEEDLPQTDDDKEKGVSINKNACIGCKICVKNYPELFEMSGNKAKVKGLKFESIDEEKLEETIELCPVSAIENN